MEHLFAHWDAFTRECRAATIVLLLADYDGTLTPIVGRPQDAVLADSMRARLAVLNDNPAFRIGIISGRETDELMALVGIGDIYYAGNHGLEIRGPGGLDYLNDEAARAEPVLHDLAGKLAAACHDIGGVYIEDKRLSISVHYRLVETAREREVEDIVRRLTAPALEEGTVWLTAGKKVWELRPPVAWGKGQAIQAIQREAALSLRQQRLLTVFLGDDLTDEDGFSVLSLPAGWGIYVGDENGNSSAPYRLDSPAEVEEFLVRLAALKQPDYLT